MTEMIHNFKAMLNTSAWEIGSVDIGVLIGYFILMAVVGYICRKSSSDVSDYIRMGCKATWWLMGLSIFMQAISALTFTGACGQAYVAGWSALFTTIGGVSGLLCQAAFFAPWLRRTRAVTPADAVRQRYGPVAEQVFVYLGSFGGTFWGGMMLLGLATFLSAIFNLPVPVVILFVGVIVVFYSVSGGSWSVQITDSLQSMIMVPICMVVLFLSLKAVGGFSGLLQGIKDAGLAEDFQMIMPANHEYTSKVAKIGAGYFTIPWFIASFMNAFIQSANMTTCWRFLSTKSDSDARKAALLAAALLMFGAFVWYIPPMVARIKFADKVEALARVEDTEAAKALFAVLPDEEAKKLTEGIAAGLTKTQVEELSTGQTQPMTEAEAKVFATKLAAVFTKPAYERATLNNVTDGAYAMAAKELLPPGLLGLIIIAMFAATMSSMDSALTGTAGLVTKNIYPPLARLCGIRPLEGKPLLRLTQVVNLLLGAWAMTFSYLLYTGAKDSDIYQICLNIVLLVGAPTGLAFALSFFVKTLPKWGPLVGMGVGFACSATFMFIGKVKAFLYSTEVFAPVAKAMEGLMWHHRMFIMTGCVLGSTLLTALFWRTTDATYRAKVDKFFTDLRTPIDFAKEVGEDADHSLLKTVGGLGLIMAAAIAILVFYAEDTTGRLAVMFVAGFIAIVSGIMVYFGLTGASKRAAKAKTDEALPMAADD